MSRFIETILAENGAHEPLEYHQERVDKTLRDWRASCRLDLGAAIDSVALPPSGTTKIRVEYGLNGLECIQVSEYRMKRIESISLVHIGDHDYRYKYADREWIYSLLADSGCDEIAMVKDGFLTDASIANLAFFDGRRWLTPDTPLLAGTRRRSLLETGIIREARIRPADMTGFSKLKLVNAMIPWNQSPELPIDLFRQ